MKIVLKHSLNRIKNGYFARSPELGLSASGHSEEIARRNLERLVTLYLQPFSRQGCLSQELGLAGLQVTDQEGEMTVSLAD